MSVAICEFCGFEKKDGRNGSGICCVKQTNPKDVIGSKKVCLSHVPVSVMLEISLAMQEGAQKYGPVNWATTPIRAKAYFDALFRHMAAWMGGEDTDPDSGLPHIVKALATLVVLRDAQRRGKVIDDRPPASPPFMAELNAHAARLAQGSVPVTTPQSPPVA